MRIAVIGSGGREHAILWRLARDPHVHDLLAIPGNGGTASLARSEHPDGAGVENLAACIARMKPELVVVGPEVPLAEGLADLLHARGIPCFGPTRAAAQIEASKVFAKRFMRNNNIPTAGFEVFTDFDAVRNFLGEQDADSEWVVKADGLAAGKGAFVCAAHADVLAAAHSLLVAGTLGDAGRSIVIESKLAGREVSALFLCDGERVLALPPAQDYKRAYDHDAGPNTGGMGAFCPAPQWTAELADQVLVRIVRPTLRGLAELGSPYRGVLYAGLMLTTDGPQVIEFNCRFGDPETQVILPLLPGDFAAMLMQCAAGRLPDTGSMQIAASGAAVCVVLAADGYPGDYRTGLSLPRIADPAAAFTLHAGTAIVDGQLVSTGGRVLNAVGTGTGLAQAREHAYALAAQLRMPGLRCRTDIAKTE